ncbi:hypothetical protein [Xanthomonas arboricola]|uniref:hypothetical protein n=1 Tax=Xanthomonas arboricola TaxID=56448 RepID=UPI0021577738|nr:hypothetical protein [Xanthomonas arboricola]
MARQVSIATLLGAIGFLVGPACAMAVDGGAPSKPTAQQVPDDLHKRQKHSEISQGERVKVTVSLDRSDAALEAQRGVAALQSDRRAAVPGDQAFVTQISTKAGENGGLIAGARVHLVRR